MALRDNMISWWELNESSTGSGAVTRVDAHGSNDLTDNNTTASGTGIQGNCADLERTNSEWLYITDASQTGLDITGDYSFSGWFNIENAPTAGQLYTLFSKYNRTGNQRSYEFYYYNNSGTYQLVHVASSDGNAGTVAMPINQSLSTATWYHLVLTYDASAGSSEYFVNGTSIGTVTGGPTSIYNGTATFMIGSQHNDPHHFDGLIDECSIYSAILTGTEISELYNSGSGLSYADTAGGGGGGPASATFISLLGAG